MFGDRSPTIRASRVAIAGSIYMRRSSLQMFKPKQTAFTNGQNAIRNPSYGKIVKNISRKIQDNSIGLNLATSKSRNLASPLLDKKNIMQIAMQKNYVRKSQTPSFGNFDNYQNLKIKTIQQKYKAMLSDYQSKKKTIDSELSSLRSSVLFEKKQKFSSAYKQNRQGCILSQRSQKGPKEDLYKQYEKQSKQMVIQKLNTKQPNQKTNKKQKITDLYPNFFKALKNQLMLEEELKNIKKSMPAEIKQQVQKILMQNNEVKDKKLLQTDEEQFDPFENVKICNLSAQAQATKLIKKFEQCELNWISNVCVLSQKQAQEIFYALNFQKSEEISLKSLVRELSFLLQKHLRNRELSKIYKRISPLTQLNFCRKIALKQ